MRIYCIIGALLALQVSAGPEDADRTESTFRQYWVDRFTQFTQDQNVAGKGARPDGTAAVAGKKRKFNNDDGVQYEGYLTYHDFSFNTIEKAPQKNNTGGNSSGGTPVDQQTRTLYGFVSKHGAISAAGGSSLLERTVYEQHEKYLKEEEGARKNGKSLDNDKTGVKYKSIFKVTTDKISKKDDPSGSGTLATPSKSDDPEEKVERWELRPEVRTEVEKIGEESFKTVEASARDRGSENDENALPNSTLMYEAASRAYDAWWNSTLANLSQARANRAVRGGPQGIRAQLDEDNATCEKWVFETRSKLQSQSPLSPSDQKELDRMLSQCKEMVSMNYRAVNPSFEKDEKDPNAKESLQEKGPDKEDARERDLRLQMEVLANPQVDPNELPTNWKFQNKDTQTKVTVGFDESARNAEVAETTVGEQVKSYNDQLASAAGKYEEIKKRFPDLDVNPKQVLQYQIKGQPTAKEISALPKDIYSADSGVEKAKTKSPAKNYSQLLDRQKE